MSDAPEHRLSAVQMVALLRLEKKALSMHELHVPTARALERDGLCRINSGRISITARGRKYIRAEVDARRAKAGAPA